MHYNEPDIRAMGRPEPRLAATSLNDRTDAQEGRRGGSARREERRIVMTSHASRPTVLLVDDNPELLAMLADGLADEFEIVTARDGAEGLEVFLGARPACAVIDIKMPNIDGYRLIRALRGDPETAESPLIILTALNQDTARLAGLLVGADRFMTKPVVPSELIPAIYQAIATTESDRQQRYQMLLDGPEEG